MAKFRAERIIIREVADLIIIFWNAESIYVYEKDSQFGSIFNNWWAYRGSYEECWAPFRRKMLRYQKLTMTRCHELASYHNVVAVSTGRRLDLSGKKVEIRDKYFRVSGSLDDVH